MPARELNTKRIPTKRAASIEYESSDVIRKCLAHSLRSNVDQVYRKDDNVQALRWEMWVLGFRFLAHLGRSGLVENGGAIEVVPLCNIRPAPPIEAPSDAHVEFGRSTRTASEDDTARPTGDMGISRYQSDPIDRLSFIWNPFSIIGRLSGDSHGPAGVSIWAKHLRPETPWISVRRENMEWG